jgi:hypothetical protein
LGELVVIVGNLKVYKHCEEKLLTLALALASSLIEFTAMGAFISEGCFSKSGIVESKKKLT